MDEIIADQSEGSCPAAQIYTRADKLRGVEDYLVMTVQQVDNTDCDPGNLERLAEALITEVER